MASSSMTVRIELDEVKEAAELMLKVHQKLARKHGEKYRKLERLIEEVASNIGDHVSVTWLIGGVGFFSPSGKFTEVLKSSRELGLVAE